MTKKESLYQDYYVKIISNLFINTDWYELFKLNFNESMELEYSTYMYLKKILDLYHKKSNPKKEEINKNMKKLEDTINNMKKI